VGRNNGDQADGDRTQIPLRSLRPVFVVYLAPRDGGFGVLAQNRLTRGVARSRIGKEDRDRAALFFDSCW
jgi:hypothetical protein